MQNLKILCMSQDDFPDNLLTVGELKKILSVHANEQDKVVFSTQKFNSEELAYFTGASVHEKIGSPCKLIALHVSRNEID